MKTAIVIGSTGLVGSELVTQLQASPHYSSVVLLNRRPSGIPRIRSTICCTVCAWIRFPQLGHSFSAVPASKPHLKHVLSLTRSWPLSIRVKIKQKILAGDKKVLRLLRQYSEGVIDKHRVIRELELTSHGQMLDVMGIAGLPLPRVPKDELDAMVAEAVKVIGW